jgi:outer membrane protein insertion porin family
MSLGYNLAYREFDNSNFNTASFSSTNASGQVVLGLPITENDTVSALFGIDSNQINVFPGSTPPSIIDYIDALNQRTFHSWRSQLAWARDTRNDYFTPTRGTYQRVSAELTLPGSTVEYYKLNYDFSKFWPLSRALVLNTRVSLGYGNSYGGAVSRDVCFTAGTYQDTDNNPATPPVFVPGATPSEPCLTTSPDYVRTITADGLPFFENFYAGGTRSVRGFRDNTLGPREGVTPTSTFKQPLGGAVKTTGSLEMYFPTLIKSPSARVSAFVDFGNVFANTSAFSTSELRASAGVAVLWRAPVGPISISYAFPIRQEPGDEIERLQFTFGGAF